MAYSEMCVTESSDEFVPSTADEAASFLADNAAGDARAVYPVGGRTALHYGYESTRPGMCLSTARLNRTIDYPARDMTITVEAGIRMEELATLLKAEGQRLPVDVAQASRATLGGVVATDSSGPRRYGLGTMRDYVIGVTAINAEGKTFHAGGRVVKNVAGYDLCKLLVGSQGTLAVVTQLTLKLKPLPETSALLWCRFSDWPSVDAALENLLSSVTRPVAVEVLNSSAAAETTAESRLDLPTGGPVLCVGFEGTERETNWQAEQFKSELASAQVEEITIVQNSDVDALWFALTEFAVSSDEPLTFQASLRPSRTIEFIQQATEQGVSVTAHAGDGVVIGQLPDEIASLDAMRNIIRPLRDFATEADGNLVILDCESAWKKELKVFGEEKKTWPLMKEVKRRLDPNNILNPGRFLDGL